MSGSLQGWAAVGWTAPGPVPPLVLAAGWAVLIVAARVRHGPDPVRVRAVRGREPTPVPVPVVVATAVLVAAWAAPPLGLAVALAAWAVPRVRRRRAAARARAAVEADLPEVVDLLRMCVGAGLTVPLAVDAVARRADGPVAHALAAAVDDARQRGRRLADALEDLPDRVGEPVRGLVGVLVGSERYGHAIGPALERLAGECRADERRRAEAAARRVPVLLLFPLVTCILPAFALLTVAPLIAGALRALRLS